MRTEAWVINASPLILFSRVGRLDLIEQIAPAVKVPETVINEVLGGTHRDRTATAAATWAARFRVPDLTLPPTVERWNPGPGESRVIRRLAGAVTERVSRALSGLRVVPDPPAIRPNPPTRHNNFEARKSYRHG